MPARRPYTAPDSTPRQTPEEVTEATGNGESHVDNRVKGDWGQTPEKGNPTADFHPGALKHKALKRAWVVPFPDAMPFAVRKPLQQGGEIEDNKADD